MITPADRMKQYRANHPEFYEKEKLASKARMKERYNNDEEYRLRKLEQMAIYRQNKKDAKLKALEV